MSASLFDPTRRASTFGSPIQLEESVQCWVPTALSVARCSGFLWCRAGKGAWKRYYAVCCANFIVLFQTSNPNHDELVKPAAALCYEDLTVEHLDPPPMEKEVAEFCQYAFSVSPREDKGRKRAGLFSATAARGYHFCAESEEARLTWSMTLEMWRHSALADAHVELSEARQALQEAEETHKEQLLAAERTLAECREQAASHAAAAEATHTQKVQVEETLRSTELTLREVQAQLHKQEAEGKQMEQTVRKMRIYTALHKTSRDTLRQQMDEMASTYEARLAAATAASAVGADGATGDLDGVGPEGADAAQGRLRGLMNKGRKDKSGTDRKKLAVGFVDDADGGEQSPSSNPTLKTRKVSPFVSGALDEDGGGAAPEEVPLSDVDEETAISLLARTQECSAHFRDFAPAELVTLANTLTVMHFKDGDTLLCQGEPATFFGVVLEGSVAPVVNSET